MKAITIAGIYLVMVGLVMTIVILSQSISAYYNFEKDYYSSWELSDRSSTISAKETYIDKFVTDLENNKDNFCEYNAIFLKTPQNNFENNLEAVKTLRDRLKEIKSMNESSFEYQTAIQQITSQEQGEAHNLISTIESCYYLKNYPLVWGWIMGCYAFVLFLCFFMGFIFITIGVNDY